VKLNGSGKQGHGKPTKSPPPLLPPNTIVLTSGQLTLAKNLTIQGPGAGQLTISGNYPSRVFEVAQNTTVTLSRMTVSGGTSGYGGGVFNQGALTLNGCTVSGNFAFYTGGGIYNLGGTLSISNSTFSGNQARFGGAIYNAGGTVTIDSSTLSGNSAFHADYPWSGGDGGGIYNDASGTVTVRNFSSITGNTSQWSEGLGPDVYNLGTIYRDGTSTIGALDGNAVILI
jgi:predicted outer membrane repeat protein